ncbi:putative methyltransferase C9orf114 [Neolecta irregularis DAH-3]|uniref:Putative methyltransferase C9orf114 n=1 Tax=Neolecta irregularis (strain DAH-3) TaxID=1198029 RepID=A0A1U7LNI4_NEOID|nr:putative methyltransferase C9orf114 [Neolecta irregularis DAH-3]|eukprot:OLL24215.1 putative methyltransferase C9orf114 [Neolecta irregularis DAH-3]
MPPQKKRKHYNPGHIDTSKPSANPILKDHGQKYTLSVALPGSIIANSQTPELKTALAGSVTPPLETFSLINKIARSLAIFNVDEIVIYDDTPKKSDDQHPYMEKHAGLSASDIFLAKILQYLETPQYLRKSIFPMHRDLKFAGLLNPLDCPHHLRIDDDLPFREGITLLDFAKNGTLVDAGLRLRVFVPGKRIHQNTRVTVRIKKNYGEYIEGEIVPSTTPKQEVGLYWGYKVRIADSISAVFTESPYTNGYDITLGTSERGDEISSISIPEFSHMLVVFGGLAGIEYAIDNDPALEIQGSDAKELFDLWINTCPEQGSRTIRTEEAVLITLGQLRGPIKEKGII